MSKEVFLQTCILFLITSYYTFVEDEFLKRGNDIVMNLKATIPEGSDNAHLKEWLQEYTQVNILHTFTQICNLFHYVRY